jgi:hypothetical protein
MSECQITISDLQVVHSEREVYTRWFCAFLRSLEAYDQHVIAIFNYEEVYFWPSNYSQCLVLAIKPESQESSTIELLKPFTIGPWAVLVASFADVDSTCRWDPLVHLFYLFSLPPSLPPLLHSLSRALQWLATRASSRRSRRASCNSVPGQRHRLGELDIRLGPARPAEQARC